MLKVRFVAVGGLFPFRPPFVDVIPTAAGTEVVG